MLKVPQLVTGKLEFMQENFSIAHDPNRYSAFTFPSGILPTNNLLFDQQHKGHFLDLFSIFFGRENDPPPILGLRVKGPLTRIIQSPSDREWSTWSQSPSLELMYLQHEKEFFYWSCLSGATQGHISQSVDRAFLQEKRMRSVDKEKQILRKKIQVAT